MAILGAGTAVIALELIVRKTNSGIGIFGPSRKAQGEYVMTSKYGRVKPVTREEYYKQEMDKFWLGLGNQYTKKYFQAVYNTEHGKPQLTFTVDGQTFNTKGGYKV